LISETGATIHLWVQPKAPSLVASLPANTDSQSRIAIKQGWWRQFINSTFVETFPRIKGFTFFEFIKFEETTWRDFTSLGMGTALNSPFGNDGGVKDGPVLKAFQDDMATDRGKLIIWGKEVAKPTTNVDPPPKSDSYAADMSILSFLYSFILLL
jgi:hypothetical protein